MLNLRPTTGANYNFYNNIFEATNATMNGNAVFGAGVYLQNSAISLVKVSGNYIWQSNPGTSNIFEWLRRRILSRFSSTLVGRPNTDVWYGGSHYRTSFPFGTNTYANPGFANPQGLPTTVPNCASYTNTTDCMNQGYHVAASLTPSGGAVGKGYQPPGSCAPDPYFPTWLKGVVYLQWNGTSLTDNSGVITMPCEM
jgi:hypothetical protein